MCFEAILGIFDLFDPNNPMNGGENTNK